jgi:hypothetical protein
MNLMCSPVPLQIAQVTFSVGTLFTEARLTVLLDLQDTDPAYHKPDRQEYYEPGLAPFHSARSKKKTRLLLQPHTTEISTVCRNKGHRKHWGPRTLEKPEDG